MIDEFLLNMDDVPRAVIDPLVENLTLKQLYRDIKDYKNLLDTKSNEQLIHSFLASHSYFFNTLIRLYGVSPLYSKVKLGSNFEVDFAFFDSGSYGPEWELIEIESSKQKMFNKNGDSSAALTHAIKQVEEWHSWIHENLDYARKLMPFIDYPLGHVFIGRRKDLTYDDTKRLKRLNYTYRKSIEIHTLDYFSSGAESVINLVERNNKGDWYVPMHTLSHSTLSNGLPDYAQAYLSIWLDEKKRLSGKKKMIKGRDWSADSNYYL